MKTTGYMAMVEWDDAYFMQVIMPAEEAVKMPPYTVQSLGWVLSDTKKDIRIATSQINDGRIRDILVVPKGMVRRVIKLKAK